jgi:hypothetical protein
MHSINNKFHPFEQQIHESKHYINIPYYFSTVNIKNQDHLEIRPINISSIYNSEFNKSHKYRHMPINNI